MPIIVTGFGGGGGGTATLISTTTLAAPGTFNLTAIPQSYKHLLIVSQLRGTVAGSETGHMTFNNDGGANYAEQSVHASGTSAAGISGAATTKTWAAFFCPGSDTAANTFGAAEMTVFNYAATDRFKTGVGVSAQPGTAIANANGTTAGQGICWASTAAITSIQIFGNLATNLDTGSIVRLYGLN